MEKFRANGKILLSGEYVVLDGALSLALPTRFGQSLEVSKAEKKGFFWESYSSENKIWFKTELFKKNDCEKTKMLENILLKAGELNPRFLKENKAVLVKTFLDFPDNWGLGSSSTLIYCIAQWAKVNVFELFFRSFTGSGYDIACAGNNTPLFYYLKGSKPVFYPVSFNPEYKNKIFFVHQNKKQNSQEGILQYRKFKKSKVKIIQEISQISENIVRNQKEEHFAFFEELLTLHEEIISKCIQLKPLKEEKFPDFTGSIKSLGAWGGDFFLATGEEFFVKSYFNEKGFNTILSFDEMFIPHQL